jgi:hypothetical protein
VTEQNPYVGPRPFRLEDEKRFFGRSAEIDRLLSLVYAHRLVLLISRSGVGKTSLLNAGLQPQLRGQREFEVLPPTRVGGLDVAGVDPRRGANLYVANAVSTWLTPDEETSTEPTLGSVLRSRPRRIDEEGDALPRVAIFDQFEEIFTAYPALWHQRDDFFAQLRAALREDSRLRVVLALREDFLADLTPLMSGLDDFNPSTMRIEPLGREAAARAITQPLETTDRSFDPEAAHRLVEDLTRIRVERGGESVAAPGQHVEPVQLQVVCRALWERLPPDVSRITTDHLEEFGDVDDALMRFYEQSLASAIKADGVGEKRLREWFETQLITASGTRGTVNRGIEETGQVPNAVVDALEDAHIVSGATRHGSRWYELTHDRFVEPIRRSNREYRANRRNRLTLIVGLLSLVALAALAALAVAAFAVRDGPVPVPMPALEVLPADSLAEPGNFGEVFIGETATQEAVISNIGDAVAPISIGITGADEFKITENDCGQELQPGSQCRFTVQFEPTALAGFSARLSINQGQEPPAVRADIGLVGVGIGPSVSVSRDSIAFGEVILPGFLDAEVEVRNNGRIPLVITDVGVGTEEFLVESACIGLLDPGQMCTIVVRFEPSSIGSFTDSLVVDYERLESSFVSLSASATSAQVEVGPGSIDFGTVRLGEEAPSQFTIRNSGTAAIVLGELDLVAGERAGFAISQCPVARLLPNESCVVDVVFSPESEGSSEARVMLALQDDIGRQVETRDVALVGRGGVPRLDVSPTFLGWAECFSECGVERFSQDVTLINQGTAAPGIFDARIVGSDADAFILSVEDGCLSLPPDQGCLIEVTYIGTFGAEEVAQLVVSFGTDQASVELSGVDVIG